MLQSSQLEGRRCIVHQKGLWVSDRPAWRSCMISDPDGIKIVVNLMHPELNTEGTSYIYEQGAVKNLSLIT